MHFEHPAGDIVVEPTAAEDGRIARRFSANTLISLRDLLGATERLPPLANAVAPVAKFDAAGRVPLFFSLRQGIEGFTELTSAPS